MGEHQAEIKSLVNTGEQGSEGDLYSVDDGTMITHKPDDGAVVLAKKLLDTIVEQGV